jgi:ubiquinol-cytochrome c reductase cytochrome b subunit
VRPLAGWGRVFGPALAFALALQAVTGLCMASFYAPSSTTAWAAVAYIQQEVTLGWFIRGLHSAGASMTVTLLGLHLLQSVTSGAYARTLRRNWLLGLVLLALVLAFALTGYLLPWDQKGYWATQVVTSLLGETPLLGDYLRRVVQGGGDYGNLTLTHFYALHTMLLPAVTTALIVVHVRWSRRAGAWWPDDAWKDAVAVAVVVAVGYAMVVRTHGAPLEAPADPSSAYDARPEWYFLPLFQMLKYLPGKLETIGALGLPLVLGAVLFVLPRVPTRPAVAIVCAIFAGAGALMLLAHRDDAHNEPYKRGRARAEAEAKRALELAKLGVPPAGGMAVYDNDPELRARKIFVARCAGCHELDGAGDQKAPLLTGWSSRAWLDDFLAQPDAPKYFGPTKKLHGMKPVKAQGDDKKALVEWIYSQGGGTFDRALAQKGLEVVKRDDCEDCHSLDGKSEGVEGAPNLAGRAGVEWIERLIRNAGDPTLFSDRNEMPKFGSDKLSDDDVAALAALIARQRS